MECGRGIDGSLCSNLGVCGYDFDAGTAKCYCYAGYEGDSCDTETPFYGEKAWYDAIETSNDSVQVIFETKFGFNITYDLQYLIDGYLNDRYYKLTNFDGTDHIYFNLLDPIQPYIDNTLCINNDELYDYGYIFETITNAPGAICYSLGRDPPNVTLYDDNLPAKGIYIYTLCYFVT